MRALMLFVPTELLVLVLVTAALALLIGARTLARTLVVFAGCMVLLPVLLEPLFASLPDPILMLVLIGLGVAMLFALVRALGVMLIGRRSTEAMVGILSADVVRSSLRGTLAASGWVARTLLRVLRPLIRP